MAVIRALLAAAALVLSGLAHAQDTPVTPYTDSARGFATMIPVGWTDPAGSLTTRSGDQTIHCTFSVSPNPRTAGMDQESINKSLAVYTADVWRQQFFTGGTTGTIEVSGITRLEAFDAPWARGMITYPGRGANKFGVLLVAGPGKIVTVTCLGDAGHYAQHIFEIGKVMNYLRPL